MSIRNQLTELKQQDYQERELIYQVRDLLRQNYPELIINVQMDSFPSLVIEKKMSRWKTFLKTINIFFNPAIMIVPQAKYNKISILANENNNQWGQEIAEKISKTVDSDMWRLIEISDPNTWVRL